MPLSTDLGGTKNQHQRPHMGPLHNPSAPPPQQHLGFLIPSIAELILFGLQVCWFGSWWFQGASGRTPEVPETPTDGLLGPLGGFRSPRGPGPKIYRPIFCARQFQAAEFTWLGALNLSRVLVPAAAVPPDPPCFVLGGSRPPDTPLVGCCPPDPPLDSGGSAPPRQKDPVMA